MDQNVESGFCYLFRLIENGSPDVNTTKLLGLLDFVAAPGDTALLEPEERAGGKGIVLKAELNTDLETLLRYFYNPDIPGHVVAPSVLRLTGWYAGTGLDGLKRNLWEELPTLSRPVMVRGREYEVNTPDSFAGSYYRYDLDRLLVLMKYQGRNVLVSVTKQDGQSGVGCKGAVLNDAGWQYFYSGIPGLNMALAGWMDTHMYDSASVQVFMENPDKTVTLCLVKWLSAGWAGMNVVKRSHIMEGSERYVRSLKTVLESSELTPEDMAENIREVTSLSQAEVDSRIEEYARNLEIRYKNDPKLGNSEFAEVIANGGYEDVLTPEERVGVLCLQKLKCLLGMETLVDMCVNAVADSSDAAPSSGEVSTGSRL